MRDRRASFHDQASQLPLCVLRGFRDEIVFAVIEVGEDALAWRPRGQDFPWYAEGKKGGGMVAIAGNVSHHQNRNVVSPWCAGEDASDMGAESVAPAAGAGDVGETLTTLSNAELWSRTLASNARRRRAVALLVAHLAEVERRSLHLREGYSSLYDFCLRGLGMSEGEAHRSISSARVARRFPIAVGMLADGRLHLTGLSLLASRLTESNHAELLEEACGKTKADIQVVLARWFPRPGVPDCVELLGAAGWRGGSNEARTDSVAGSEHCSDVHAGGRAASGAQGAAPGLIECGGHGGAGSGDCRTREQVLGNARGTEFHDSIEPRSAERFAIRFSASAAFKAKLEHARNLMSHVGRSLETVFERALDLLIAERENKCWGKTEKPRRSPGAKHGAPTRHSKREVYERDAGQCTYVSSSGVHCTARAYLNFDHIKERANGGGGAADNGQLLCAAHNQMRARQTFGDAFINDKIARRRRKTRSSSALENERAASPPNIHQRRSQALGDIDRGEDANGESVRQRKSPALDLEGGDDANGESVRQRRSQEARVAGARAHTPSPRARALPMTSAQQSKLVSALTAMGFRTNECRKAVVELASCEGEVTMDQLLRRALASLVPG